MRKLRRNLLPLFVALGLSIALPLLYKAVLVVAADPALPLSLTLNGSFRADVWEGSNVAIAAWMNCAGETITVEAFGSSSPGPHALPDPVQLNVTYPALSSEYTVTATSPVAGNSMQANVAVVDISLSSTVPATGPKPAAWRLALSIAGSFGSSPENT